MKTFERLSWISLAAVYLLLVLGGTVSATGSGLACPDWPLCHGELVPPLQGPVLVEYSHRLLASVAGLLILFTSIAAWRQRRHAPGAGTAAGLAVVLLIAQVLLGAVTVLHDLPPAVVALHLAMGTALLATLASMVVLSRGARLDPLPPQPRGEAHALWPLLATGALYVEMVLGSYLDHSGAGLACPDVPLCRGAVIPPLEGGTLIHFSHRAWALVVAVLVFVAAAKVRRAYRGRPFLHLLPSAAVFLVLLQILLGGLTVVSRLAPALVVLHLANAEALLLIMVFLSAGCLKPAAWTAPAFALERHSI